jgi:hypothetical protein
MIQFVPGSGWSLWFVAAVFIAVWLFSGSKKK